jgi:hypothetical protein
VTEHGHIVKKKGEQYWTYSARTGQTYFITVLEDEDPDLPYLKVDQVQGGVVDKLRMFSSKKEAEKDYKVWTIMNT